MPLWLFKEEPGHYPFAQLMSDGSTVWDGVSNHLALKYLRQVKKGDRIFFYHTGKEKAVVGIMRARCDARETPIPDEPRRVLIEVEPVEMLPNPVPLSKIKEDLLLADWELVKLPRLSILPVSESQWQRIEELSRQGM